MRSDRKATVNLFSVFHSHSLALLSSDSVALLTEQKVWVAVKIAQAST